MPLRSQKHYGLTKSEAKCPDKVIGFIVVFNDMIPYRGYGKVHALLSHKSDLPLCHYAAHRLAAASASLSGKRWPFNTSLTRPGLTRYVAAMLC